MAVVLNIEVMLVQTMNHFVLNSVVSCSGIPLYFLIVEFYTSSFGMITA
jgi:hypothetical protein